MSDHSFTTPAARKPLATYDGRATAPKSSRYKRGRIGLGPPVRSLPSGDGDEERPDDHESTFSKFDGDDLGLDLRLDSVFPPSASPVPTDLAPLVQAPNSRPEQSTLAQLIQQLNVAAARAQYRTLDASAPQDRPSPLRLDHGTTTSAHSPSEHSLSQTSEPSPGPAQPTPHTSHPEPTPGVYTTSPNAATPQPTLPVAPLPAAPQPPLSLSEATATRSHPSPALATTTPNSLKSQSPGAPSPTNPPQHPSTVPLGPTRQASAAPLQSIPTAQKSLHPSHPLQAYPSPPLAPSAPRAPAAPAQPIPPPLPAQPVPPDRKCLYMNGRPYTRLGLLGRGGSSKVYKVMGPDHRLLAIKKVALAKADPATIQGYINEINLLRRLHQSEYIIRLVDAEVNHARGFILIGLECGEIDLAHILQRHQDKPLNLNFVRMYWEQMLEAVHAIHEQKIVHSDLKPANFLLVAGTLKLIDFGIAKAIANDTTNIHREHQIGTVNYMSPEAIEDTNTAGPGGRRCMK
ncbi:Dual-specificity kinase, spindle pole body (SPB) duplication and spindle checkpoint function, partial [Dimargaris xerosporica]